MDGKFITVFSEEDRDKLLALGFVMLSNDSEKFTFALIEDQKSVLFSQYSNLTYVVSDTLTF